MTEPIVHRLSALIPMSDEAAADAIALAGAWHRWLDSTPEERAAALAEAAAKRADERRTAQLAELTLDALLDKLGFSNEYALHLVQPYCTCSDGYDGWERCAHARDEGLVTS